MKDLLFACRQLLIHRWFSFLAALSFALGIGLVTTQFSLIDGILLRGLPIPDAQRLMHIGQQANDAAYGSGWTTLPYRDYLEFRERQTSFESLAAVNVAGINVSVAGQTPFWHAGGLATYNMLEPLGVKPMLGRWFTADEDRPGQPLLVVLSHSVWEEQFGSDPQVLGRPLKLSGEPGTIIGVMPPKFSFPFRERIWANLRPAAGDPRLRLVDRVNVMGKLRPGVTLGQARAEFDAIARTLAAKWPETNRGIDRMYIDRFTFATTGSNTPSLLYLMLAMTVFILLLACVNVANMLLGSAARRARELAVRTAVGASRWRLVRQLLVEALVLATVGAAGGLLLALYGVDLLQRHLMDELTIPGWFDFRLDHRVTGIAVVFTMLAGMAAGLLPALRASRVDVGAVLKDESRGSSGLGLGRVSRWLVTAQIAFTAMLLVAASVMAWSVREARSANLKYHPEHLLTGRIELRDYRHPTPAARATFYREVLSRIAALPGVEAVGVTSRGLVGSGVPTQVAPEGVVYPHDNARPTVWLEVLSPGYLGLLGIQPIQGRLLDDRDRSAASRNAVVTESFARKFWPDGDALGRRFRSSQTDDGWVTVVGVVPDLQMEGLIPTQGTSGAGFLLSQDEMGWGWLDLIVRAKGDPLTLVDSVRQAITGYDPEQPIHTVTSMEAYTALMLRGYTIVGAMAGVFALVTLFLGSVGVYGVTSLAVSRRTREFGVRMALGATVGQVLRLVLAQGGQQIGVGLILGMLAAFFLTRPLQHVFGGSLVNSPAIYLGVAALIVVVGLIALWVPARRAANIDPMEALRND